MSWFSKTITIKKIPRSPLWGLSPWLKYAHLGCQVTIERSSLQSNSINFWKMSLLNWREQRCFKLRLTKSSRKSFSILSLPCIHSRISSDIVLVTLLLLWKINLINGTKEGFEDIIHHGWQGMATVGWGDWSCCIHNKKNHLTVFFFLRLGPEPTGWLHPHSKWVSLLKHFWKHFHWHTWSGVSVVL